MSANYFNIIKISLSAFLFMVMPFGSYAERTPEQIEKENQALYRVFVRLLNYGPDAEFYDAAELYENFLKEHNKMTEYFKIKTNEGFYDADHHNLLRAMKTAEELDAELHASARGDLYYLATGLKGDLHKAIRSEKADSLYRQALDEVGNQDPKFTMMTEMSLAQVNYLTDPEEALKWASRAIKSAEELNNIEHQSMALGMKGYIYFMLGMRDEFNHIHSQYKHLKKVFDLMEKEGRTMGKQRFSHRYDEIFELAERAFEGDFDGAMKIAEAGLQVIDPQLVIYRINSMEGTYEKDRAARQLRWWLIGLTVLYIFVYIMGRRRLMRQIWKRERELRVALEKADTANQMKTAFIRSMSHEIRTPLNAINGFSQILCTDGLELTTEEKEDMKHRVASSTEAITIIINELLEMAAGESVSTDFSDMAPVIINETCLAAVERIREHNEKQLEITFRSELPESFATKSNEETISQILDKILDNALKFTDKGRITMLVRTVEHNVEISVTDTGKGIPEAKQEMIFENFVKLDDFSDGIGLGLSICRRLTKKLGGNITIDKDYKKGSRFIVQLPIIK